MKTKSLSLFLLLISSFIIFACSSRGDTESSVNNFADEEYDESSIQESVKNSSSPIPVLDNPSSSLEVTEQINKYTIKTADIKMLVKDVNVSTDDIDKILKKNGGFVSNSNLETKPYSFSNTLNIRIPATKFDPVIKEITTLAEYMKIIGS